MAPPTKAGLRTVSQQAFDEMVRENIEDLGMDPTEALQDAIQTLTLQSVDLSGIIAAVPGESNPLVECIEKLKRLDDSGLIKDSDDVADVLKELNRLCSSGDSGNEVAVAVRNGGLGLVCSVCSKICGDGSSGIVSGFEAMALLIYDLETTNTFYKNDGPKMVVDTIYYNRQNFEISRSGFSVVAAAAAGNEVVKEKFMELYIDELMFLVLQNHGKEGIPIISDAIRVLLTPDDNRVVASQVYGYARRFAKAGITAPLVLSLKEELTSPSLVSAIIALKAFAVNDEICRSMAESGGVDGVLRCIDDSGEQGNKTVAKACCSLLSKLAGSDTIKSDIVEKGGMDRLITFSNRFSDDPSVLQEVMSIISVLCLRLPGHASRAIEAGAGDLAKHSMQRFPGAQQMQRNACSMIRNLVARNPENRTILLNNGIEKIIRKAKENHESCKEAATDALRDLGLDNYNL